MHTTALVQALLARGGTSQIITGRSRSGYAQKLQIRVPYDVNLQDKACAEVCIGCLLPAHSSREHRPAGSQFLMSTVRAASVLLSRVADNLDA